MMGFLERNLSRHKQKWLKSCLLTMISLLAIQSGNIYFPMLVLIREKLISGVDVTGTTIACGLELFAEDITIEDIALSGVFFSLSLRIKEKKTNIKERTRIIELLFLLFSIILLQK